MGLDELRLRPGQIWPTAAQHNGLLDHLLRQQMDVVVLPGGRVARVQHPFRVSVARWVKAAGSSSTLVEGRTWRVNVNAGTVNDRLPTMLYSRSADVRGWQLPDGYVGGGDDERWVERDLLDDPEDLPYLVMQDPGQVSERGDFERVTDAQREQLEGGAFCGAADWELELWRAHVLVSALPVRSGLGAFALAAPPPRLVRYRVYAVSRLPVPTFGARSGGWRELATVYLLRRPGEPDSAEIRVRQRVFFSLWSIIVQPGQQLVGLLEAASNAGDPWADVLRGQIESSLDGLSRVEWWSV